jgi:hypothetical protein
MKKYLIVIVAFGLLLAAALPCGATPLVLNTWVVLDEYGPGGTSMLGNFYDGNSPWTWTGTGTLKVTDLFVVGDGFSGFDKGVQIFANPVPWPITYVTLGVGAYQSPPYTSNPDVAYANPDFAHATVALGPGFHSFTFQETSIPPGFNDGTIAFEVVPVPPSMLLLGSGLLGLLGLRRFRKG